MCVLCFHVCTEQVIAAGRYRHEELGPADSLVADASPISEVLNLAWAAHEITDEYLKEVHIVHTVAHSGFGF